MKFEFDPNKSASNKLKHGIDFVEAQDLWSVPGFVASSDRFGELRFVRIAPNAEGLFWTVAYTNARSRCPDHLRPAVKKGRKRGI